MYCRLENFHVKNILSETFLGVISFFTYVRKIIQHQPISCIKTMH